MIRTRDSPANPIDRYSIPVTADAPVIDISGGEKLYSRALWLCKGEARRTSQAKVPGGILGDLYGSMMGTN